MDSFLCPKGVLIFYNDFPPGIKTTFSVKTALRLWPCRKSKRVVKSESFTERCAELGSRKVSEIEFLTACELAADEMDREYFWFSNLKILMEKSRRLFNL